MCVGKCVNHVWNDDECLIILLHYCYEWWYQENTPCFAMDFTWNVW